MKFTKETHDGNNMSLVEIDEDFKAKLNDVYKKFKSYKDPLAQEFIHIISIKTTPCFNYDLILKHFTTNSNAETDFQTGLDIFRSIIYEIDTCYLDKAACEITVGIDSELRESNTEFWIKLYKHIFEGIYTIASAYGYQCEYSMIRRSAQRKFVLSIKFDLNKNDTKNITEV